MGLRAKIKSIINAIDRASPTPTFYPFAMSKEEQHAFNKAVQQSSYYLEFGLGGSTLRAIQKSTAIIHTVESSSTWISHLRQYRLVRANENKRLHIFHVDIGPTGDWGYPISSGSDGLFPRYSSAIFQVIDRTQVDLALIDGRFRVACVLKTILECHENKDLRIIIHDFWNRPQYHIVLNHLNTISRVDTMGIFSVKPDVDLQAIAVDYERFQYLPA